MVAQSVLHQHLHQRIASRGIFSRTLPVHGEMASMDCVNEIRYSSTSAFMPCGHRTLDFTASEFGTNEVVVDAGSRVQLNRSSLTNRDYSVESMKRGGFGRPGLLQGRLIAIAASTHKRVTVRRQVALGTVRQNVRPEHRTHVCDF